MINDNEDDNEDDDDGHSIWGYQALRQSQILQLS